MSKLTEAAIRKKQNRIYNTLKNLESLPRVSVSYETAEEGQYPVLCIKHTQEYVPDFRLQWCSVKEHYRVYVLVADTVTVKSNAGYCICTVESGLAAVGFANMYAFLHKQRANNKTEAYAT